MCEMCGAKKIGADMLKALLLSLNDNYTRLQDECNKTFNMLKHKIAVKNKTLRDKKEIINQKQGEITKLVTSILNHGTELEEMDAMRIGLENEVNKLKLDLKLKCDQNKEQEKRFEKIKEKFKTLEVKYREVLE